MQQVQRTGGAAADALARLAQGRVVAVGKRHGGDAAGGGRGVEEPARAGDVERERLLADDVLAGRQRGLGERQVQVVGRADVDDVDVVGAHELLGRGERAPDAELGGGLLGAGGRGGGDADDVGAREARGADVDGADEAGAGDRDSEGRGHGAGPY